jgi:hypothetical protein
MRGFAGVAVLVLVLSACGAAATPTPPPTHSITGSLALHGSAGSEFAVSGATCAGLGGYDDVTQGATVTVKDQAGTIIATGHLDAGGFNASSGCVFGFKIDPVPDATFYTIEVSHRGALTYSKDELASRSWQVAFTLGK